jgi:multiple sugar transport system substrate-binding protein
MLHQVRRATVLVAAIVVAACSPGATPSGPAATSSGPAATSSAVGSTPGGSASAEAVTLNLWIFEGEEDFLPKVKQAFESSHPGTTLEITILPEDQYTTKLDTALAAGSPPDIAFMYDPRYIKEGHMVPIGDALTEHGVDLTRFAKGPLSGCTQDGKLYCIGTYTGALVLMYNKALFDKAGVPYPSSTTPMSVDEYAALAKKLTIPNDDPAKKVWGGEAGPTYWWIDPAKLTAPDGRTVVGALDDEPTIHSWTVAAGMIHDGVAISDDQAMSMGAADLLATGQQAMSFEDNFMIGDLLDQGVDVGIAPLPVETAGEPAFVPSWTDAWSTFVKSKHPDQALDLLVFMAKEGNELREAGGAFPLDQQLAIDKDYAAGSAAKKQMLDVMGLTRPVAFVPGWFSTYGQLEDTFAQVIESGDAAAALRDVAPIIQDDLARQWETWEALN